MNPLRPPSIITDERYIQPEGSLFEWPRTRPSELWHLEGMPWWKAPIPRRWHRCWPQSVGWTDSWTGVGKDEVQRCSCGGTRMPGVHEWMWRNGRRKISSS